MFLVDMIFVKMLYDNQVSISREDFCTESEGEEYWDQSMVVFFIAKEYVLLLAKNEGNGKYK